MTSVWSAARALHTVVVVYAASRVVCNGAWGACMQVSSVHMTFNSEEEWKIASACPGWLSRMGVQFHWENDGYKCAPSSASRNLLIISV